MKKLLLSIIAAIMIAGSLSAQITGTYTIPGGTYPTIASAIAAINTSGVGTGGVTFNVNAGHTETFASPTAGLITTSTTSATNPVIFQKSGTGANPVVTAATGTGSYDYIICIGGTDYVTFDGINLQENSANTTNTTTMEYGFAIMKASATNGSQNITIKNCTLSLGSTNISSYGIYSANWAYTAPGTTLTVTSVAGANSNNKFFSNTFACFNGIFVSGYADGTAPYAYYDQGNEIGKDGANTFSSLGASATTTSPYGINVAYQNNLKIANNTFTGTMAFGSAGLYNMYLNTAYNANIDVYNNTITETYSGTGTFYGIYCSGAGSSGTTNTVNVYNNNITGNNLPAFTSGTAYFLYLSTGGTTGNFYGNNVTNNTVGSATATATGSVYYMYVSNSPTTAGMTNLYNNTIQNNSRIQSVVGSGATYVLYTTGSTNDITEYNNTINNIVIGSNSTSYLLYNLNSGTNKFVYNNTITNVSNANSSVYALYTANGTNCFIHKNKVQNITVASASSSVYGIYTSSGTNINLYNNFVSELKAPVSASTTAIYGAYFSGGTYVNFYYNTIFLNATSSSVTTFGTVGLYSSTTPLTDLRNNIIVNTSTPVGATGYTIAFKYGSASLGMLATTCNNNCFYAGTPGPNNLIYSDGTNNDQTLAAFKTRVAPREINSITENPPFVNVTTAPYDLHLKTTVATQCESGAVAITTPAITSDYDAQNRYPNSGYPNNLTTPASAPDLGADEFGGLFLDIMAPAMVYTPFMNTASTSARTLTVNITDASGVPVSGAGLPRLYWKINSGSWNSVAATFVSGSTYTFTFGGGAVLNDVISYYLVAQDNYSTPNIGSSPAAGAAGFSANPPACTTAPTTPNSYMIVSPLCGNINVGAGQTYTTLTAAMADLAIREVTCPVTYLLTDAAYNTTSGETFPIVLPVAAGISATNTVTIKPAPGVSPVISGSSTSAVIKFNGSKFITIDGSNNGTTSRNLTISNTATTGTTAVVWFGSPAMGNGCLSSTVKNCVLQNGYNTSGSYGIYVGSSTAVGTGGDDNDNISIINNAISKCYYGIYSSASALGLNDNLLISKNTIGGSVTADYLQYYGVYVTGANTAQVSDNEIFNIITTSASGSTGIDFYSNVVNGTISGNYIHDIQNNNTSGWGAYGINIGASSNVNGVKIFNNVVTKVTTINYSASSLSYNPFGIRIIGGINHQVYHNTVNLTGTQFNSGTNGSLSAAFLCNTSTVTGLDIRDNIFNNSIAGLAGSKSYAAYFPTGMVFNTINYNDYYVSGTYGVFGYYGADVTTLAAWKTATGQDAASQNLDPVYVSATDLHPSNASLNNLGTYMTTVPADFSGALRTNPPDIGAYEFGNDPVVNTTTATGVTSAAANLTGTINAAGSNVNSFFDYGLTTAYGSSTAGTPATVSGSTTTPVSSGISGLTSVTTYHYRARGVSGSLTIYGPDMTFTTTALPPAVVTTAATSVTTAGATLNGTVNANSASTTVSFEYGLTTSYGSTVAGVPATVTGNSVTPVSGSIASLAPNTTYHYRAKGVNSGGTTYGSDMTFTTAPVVANVVTTPASNITVSTAQLNGTVNANNASTTVTFEWGLTTSYGNVATATPSTVTGTTVTPVMAGISGLVANTTYHFRCVGVNAAGTSYGSDQSFLAGCPPVGAAGAVTGPATVCANSTGKVYTTGTITNATGYQWTVPAGATITAGQGTTSITVTFGTTAGNVSVYGTGPCGNGTPTNYAVAVNPLPVPTVTGAATTCQGSSNNVYSTQPGMTNYTWTVSAGGTITAGATTNAITVTWATTGAKTVTVNYSNTNGCQASTPGSLAVTVNAAPSPTITGNNSLCVNSGYYTYTTESGYSNYTWTLSPGGTINYGAGTNQVQVSWTGSGAQTISVNYNNTSGCAAATPATLNVTVNPVPSAAGAITGTASVCGGATGVAYSTAAVSGAMTYVWSLPAGATITSGAGTNNIMVDFAANASSGDITVYGNNLCGNGTVSPAFAVTVSQLPGNPGTITGDASVCAGETGKTYSVAPIAGANGYVWTVPTGASIVSGANTASVTVDFDATAASGNISVYGTSLCGNGTPSDLAVAVNQIPATPVVTVVDNVLTSSASAGNQWYFTATQGGTGSAIIGATAQSYTAGLTGWYWTVVTNGECSSDTSNNVYVVITGISNTLEGNFSMFPVPNDGKFTVTFAGTARDLNIAVVNTLGVKIYDKNISTASGSTEIDLRPAVPGVYSVIFTNGEKQLIKKIIIK